MQSWRLLKWSGSVLSPRTRPYGFNHLHRHRLPPSPKYFRAQSSSAGHAQATLDSEFRDDEPVAPAEQNDRALDLASATEDTLRQLPSPPPSKAQTSARLSALHARLMLPSRLPLETLARCLVDPSADANVDFNNKSLSILGTDLLGVYTSEHILCQYPRLPTDLMFAAMSAYIGPATSAALTREWGVEVAAAPGGEVDPGYLQCRRRDAGNASFQGTGTQLKELPNVAEDLSIRPNAEESQQKGWRRGVSSKTIYDNQFGDEIKRSELDYVEKPELRPPPRGVTLEDACYGFVKALTGAVYLHAGKKAVYNFFKAHIISRHLDVSKLFQFRQPTRDLSKLCAREGFESPTARILSETGRRSRTPVFNVGVFAGNDKLGEGSGGSLDEARIRAAVRALKGWYLYSPLEMRVPSQASADKPWEPVLVDGGEVVD